MTHVKVKDAVDVESLVHKHYELKSKSNDLGIQLLAIEQEKAAIDSELFKYVKEMKGRSLRVGNFLLMIETKTEVVPAKVTYSYKNIFDSIIKDYEFASGYIKRVMNKYMKKHKSRKNKIDSLIITEVTTTDRTTASIEANKVVKVA